MPDSLPNDKKKLQPASDASSQKKQSDRDEEIEIAHFLEHEAPEILEALPQEKRKKLISVVRSIVVTELHQGPIPCPEDIARYNEHIPNGADRIMTMAEEQSKHRMAMEKLIINSQQTQGERGQMFGLAIGLFGISVGAFVAIKGHDWVGGGIAGTTVVSLVYAFVTGKKSQRRDLQAKAKPLPHKD